MEGALSRMRTLPWRGMFALFGGFLITVSFLTFHFFGYKIMMIRVVWCPIEISFFSCHWAPSIHSAIWWPTWLLIWGGKKHAKQTKCLRTISICLKIKSLIDRHHGSPNLTYGDFIIVQSVWGMTQVSISIEWHKWNFVKLNLVLSSQVMRYQCFLSQNYLADNLYKNIMIQAWSLNG